MCAIRMVNPIETRWCSPTKITAKNSTDLLAWMSQIQGSMLGEAGFEPATSAV